MSELRELYRELLHEVALSKGSWRNEALTAFAALRGADESCSLMVVGRAVNGWESEWHAQDAADADSREEIVKDAFAPLEWYDGHPMLWVSKCWEATKGYNTRKSSFWRVIRSTVEKLGIADVSATTWPLSISWSNLYKISPAAGRNPSSTLADAQLSTCIKILRAEIQSWSPSRVLFLTGLWWAKPFLDGLGFVPQSGPSVDHVEANGIIFNQARAVVGPHPQGLAEGPLVTAIVESFGVAQQGDAGGSASGRPLFAEAPSRQDQGGSVSVPWHDAVVEAFQRIGSGVQICHRGAPKGDNSVGYTHIHGPSQPPGKGRCTNHAICVEKYNGTVAIAKPLGKRLGGSLRPGIRIQEHKLGYSHRNSYGRFGFAHSFEMIEKRWPTLDDFAREVISVCRNSSQVGW